MGGEEEGLKGKEKRCSAFIHDLEQSQRLKEINKIK